jgi:uncharacterized DUF497 family protein
LKILSFEWDEANINHIARHSVTPEEVEEACFNNPLILRGRFNRYYALGQTDTGRYIMVVFQHKFRGIARVITARDMDKSERQRYARR